MTSNAVRQAEVELQPQPAHRGIPHRSKVVCIYCYRRLGLAASAKKQAQLIHDHNCPEARLARQPAAPPPFN